MIAVTLLAGCGTFSVSPATMSPGTRTACQSLIRALPSTVSGQPARATHDHTHTTAAWGDPPITLRCGTGRRPGLGRASPCQTVDGVDWFVPIHDISDQSSDVSLTTMFRVPRVSVHVPATYRPPEAVMVDLTHAVTSGTRVTGHCH